MIESKTCEYLITIAINDTPRVSLPCGKPAVIEVTTWNGEGEIKNYFCQECFDAMMMTKKENKQ